MAALKLKDWQKRARLTATEILDEVQPRGGWTAQERQQVSELLADAFMAGLIVGAGWASSAASEAFMDLSDMVTEGKRS